MSDNSTRDLLIGAALALLLYWHYHRSGAANGTLFSNGLPAQAPSGAAATDAGCSCSGVGISNPLGLHMTAEQPASGPYAGMRAIV